MRQTLLTRAIGMTVFVGAALVAGVAGSSALAPAHGASDQPASTTSGGPSAPSTEGAGSDAEAPGSVVIDDRPGQWDAVRFYPVPGVTAAQAEALITEAAATVRVPNRGVRRVEPTNRERRSYVELQTTIGDVEGWLRWRIPARLADLDPWQQRRVLVELPNRAIVASPAERIVRTDDLIVLSGDTDIVYRLSSVRLLVLPLTGLGTVAATFGVLRVWARRVERRPIEDDVKLRKIRRTVFFAAGLLIGPVVAVLSTLSAIDPFLGALEWLVPSLTRHEATEAVAAGVTAMFLAIALLAAAALARHPSERRIRGLTSTPRQATLATVRALVLGPLPVGLWFTGVALRPDAVATNPLLSVAYLVALLVAISIASPAFVLPLVDTRRPDVETRRFLDGICERFGLRVRGVRVFDGRTDESANAMIVGILPQFRYIVVSDYLLDTFSPDEVEAVMAHEVAHGKQRHLVLGLAFTAFLFTFQLVPLGGLAFLAGLFVARPAVSRRLECRADDFAADNVGLEPTVRALAKLGEAGHAGTRRGRIARLFASHPDVGRRISRLQERAVSGRQDAGPAPDPAGT